MKLAILGATGGIGSELVRQALVRGHSVTAVVRAPERLASLQPRICIQQCDLLNSAELAPALEGHDGVLSGFGPRLPRAEGDSDLLHRFAAALSNSMLNTSVRRAVIVSTAFLFKNSIFPPAYLVGRLFFASVVADAAAMEEVIAKSSLDWTLVRPPQLTDAPHTGRYRVLEGHLPAFGFKIGRADVADFMIRTMEQHASIRKVVGVSN